MSGLTLFSAASRPEIGHIHTRVLYKSETLSREVKRPKPEADTFI
jgi:hypothetical protein